jgi:DNA mismatch endonuclease (patch repair protein)
LVDIVDKETRSRMMSGIRSQNTKPEILTRKALHRLGYRFKLDSKIGKIKPDIVLRKHKVAIFTHGCYWHQHEGCKLAYSDRNYSEKWLKKFSDNKARDKRVTKQLLEEGWRVAIVWECVTRKNDDFVKMIDKLDKWIQDDNSNYIEFG